MATWKSVEGFPRYEISDKGEVRSITVSKVGDPPQKLKPKLRQNLYLEYTLYDASSKPSWILAHRLVAKHFLPAEPTRPWVNHKDGDRKNNRVENLEWSTPTENNRHADARGVRHASTNPRRAHKLTLAIAEAIRAEHKATGRTKAIAEKYALSTTMVQRIVYNRSWVAPLTSSVLLR